MSNSKPTIVVFDSGTGGRLFAAELAKNMPHALITTVIDAANAPYGNRDRLDIQNLVETALKPYIDTTDLIVIACNTATANAAEYLRAKYPDQRFIGFEPAIKPASEQSKTKQIIVLATNATKKAPRYQKLRNKYCPSTQFTIYEPDCRTWAAEIDAGTLDESKIRATLEPYLDKNVDFISISCTHYHAVIDTIKKIVGDSVTVYDPFNAIIRYIETLICDKAQG